MYCYSNNGLSMRAVAPDYIAQTGEVIFSGVATPDELTEAFSSYAAAAENEASFASAIGMLSDSDITMHRIAEAISLGLNSWTGTDVVAWVDYRRALRVIITNQGGALPTKPAYPAGT